MSNTQMTRRFMRHVEVTDDCWLWRGSRDTLGYGRFTVSVARRSQFAHRVAYELLVGEIPNGLELDHLCRTPACVNPSHLEAVSHRENLMRSDSISAVNARKTHCPRGHAYDRVRPDGSRRCSTCDADSEKRRPPRRHERSAA